MYDLGTIGLFGAIWFICSCAFVPGFLKAFGYAILWSIITGFCLFVMITLVNLNLA